MIGETDDKNIYLIDSKECYNDEGMLITLLKDDVLFCNSRKFIDLDGSVQPETLILFVNCNDVFAWGCADAECITLSELSDLYKLHKSDAKWGSTKWVCKKRNLQPQRPIIKDMKEDGAWTSDMDLLEKNQE